MLAQEDEIWKQFSADLQYISTYTGKHVNKQEWRLNFAIQQAQGKQPQELPLK